MDTLASLVDRDSSSNSTAVPQLSNKHGDGSKILVGWLVLQLAGQVSLPVLILTMLFHKKIARRNPTIVNLCIVWFLSTIPPLMLFYAGKDGESQPSTLLCLAQAATYAGVAPMAATAYLAVVIHACTVVNNIINANAVRRVTFDIRTILLMSSPYFVFMMFAISVAAVGSQNPQDVHRMHLFCAVYNHHLSLPVFGFAIVVVILTLIAQLWISFMFYRNWAAKRRGSMTHRAVSHLDFGLLARMLFFTLFEIVIIVACVCVVLDPRMEAAAILLATPPFAVFLIFASSPDILRAWFPCLFPRKPTRTLADVQITTQTHTHITTHRRDDSDASRSSVAPSVALMAEVRPRTYDSDLEKGVPHVVHARQESRESLMSGSMASSYGSDAPLRGSAAFRPLEAPRPIHPKLVGRPI